MCHTYLHGRPVIGVTLSSCMRAASAKAWPRLAMRRVAKDHHTSPSKRYKYFGSVARARSCVRHLVLSLSSDAAVAAVRARLCSRCCGTRLVLAPSQVVTTGRRYNQHPFRHSGPLQKPMHVPMCSDATPRDTIRTAYTGKCRHASCCFETWERKPCCPSPSYPLHMVRGTWCPALSLCCT